MFSIMMRPKILIISFVLALSTLIVFSVYYLNPYLDVLPKLPVDFCYLATGDTKVPTENGYYDIVSNADLCYRARAFSRKDYHSCLKISDSTNCIAYLSKDVKHNYCDKLEIDQKITACLNILKDDPLAFRTSSGLENYKIYGTKTFTIGTSFKTTDLAPSPCSTTTCNVHNEPYLITIKYDHIQLSRRIPSSRTLDNKIISYYKDEERITCNKVNNPPVVIGGFSGDDAVIYLNSCEILDDKVVINYFYAKATN